MNFDGQYKFIINGDKRPELIEFWNELSDKAGNKMDQAEMAYDETRSRDIEVTIQDLTVFNANNQKYILSKLRALGKEEKNESKMVNSFEEFVMENFFAPRASLLNTPGMGNVSSSAFTDESDAVEEDSGDSDSSAPAHKPEPRSAGWQRPNGDYSNRKWLVGNFSEYQDMRQSMARFQIGETVTCVDPTHGCFGFSGKVIAFEDNTIVWEVAGTDTGIGAGSNLKFRCLPIQLQSSTNIA